MKHGNFSSFVLQSKLTPRESISFEYLILSAVKFALFSIAKVSILQVASLIISFAY